MFQKPLCDVFGVCGGCTYQDVSYEEELQVKEKLLRNLLSSLSDIDFNCFQSIVASPKIYHYRNRLDLKLKKIKSGEIFIGFTPQENKGVIAVDACPIADERISNFIPELKRQAIEKLPPKYKIANLTVRCGGHDRVFWGGIGRKSLRLQKDDYFWTEINGRRIFYSLDTFFQANLSILPKLFEVIQSFPIWSGKTLFYDLYGGVGFFGVGLADTADRIVLIEENIHATSIAQYNKEFNNLNNFDVYEGQVEDYLENAYINDASFVHVAMIDPPRAGLSDQAVKLFENQTKFDYLMYLSCKPEALVRDLGKLMNFGWQIKTIVPFDFFPRTKHLETLMLLKGLKD